MINFFYSSFWAGGKTGVLAWETDHQ